MLHVSEGQKKKMKSRSFLTGTLHDLHTRASIHVLAAKYTPKCYDPCSRDSQEGAPNLSKHTYKALLRTCDHGCMWPSPNDPSVSMNWGGPLEGAPELRVS